MSNDNYNVQVRMPIGQGTVVRNVPVQAGNSYQARQIANSMFGSNNVGIGIHKK